MAVLALSGCGDDEGNVETSSENNAAEDNAADDTGDVAGDNDADDEDTDTDGATQTDDVEESTDGAIDTTDDEDTEGPEDEDEATDESGATGEYADIEASLDAWVSANADNPPSECPLADTAQIEGAANDAGPAQLSVASVEVEGQSSDDPMSPGLGLICTGYDSEDAEALGIGIVAITDGSTVEEFLGGAMPADDELFGNLGSGPDGVGSMMGGCEGQECVGFWFDDTLMVAGFLSHEDATSDQLADYMNTLVPEVLDRAANLG